MPLVRGGVEQLGLIVGTIGDEDRVPREARLLGHDHDSRIQIDGVGVSEVRPARDLAVLRPERSRCLQRQSNR